MGRRRASCCWGWCDGEETARAWIEATNFEGLACLFFTGKSIVQGTGMCFLHRAVSSLRGEEHFFLKWGLSYAVTWTPSCQHQEEPRAPCAFCTPASCTPQCPVGLRAGKPSEHVGQRHSSRELCFCAHPAALSSPKLLFGLKPQPLLPGRGPWPRCLLPKGSCPSE